MHGECALQCKLLDPVKEENMALGEIARQCKVLNGEEMRHSKVLK